MLTTVFPLAQRLKSWRVFLVVFLTTVVPTLFATLAVTRVYGQDARAARVSGTNAKALRKHRRSRTRLLGSLRLSNYSDFTAYRVEVLAHPGAENPPSEIRVLEKRSKGWSVVYDQQEQDFFDYMLPLNGDETLIGTVWSTGSAAAVRIFHIYDGKVKLVFYNGSRFGPQLVEGDPPLKPTVMLDGGYAMRGNEICPTITRIWQWDPSTAKFKFRAMVPVTQKYAELAKLHGERVGVKFPSGVIGTIRVGRAPQGLAINPMTDRIYVANQYNNNVSVIDGSTDKVLANVPVGRGPGVLAVNPKTDRIYVVNEDGNTVTVIDGLTNKPIARIPTPPDSSDVAVNPETDRIYVVSSRNLTSGHLTVIDGATDKVLATINAGASPGAAAVNPVTDRVYVAGGLDHLTVIDGSTNKVIPAGAPGAIPAAFGSLKAIAVNPKTDKIYVAVGGEASDCVKVIDGNTGATRTVNLPAHSYPVYLADMAVDPATNKIYAVSYNAGTLTVIDGVTDKVTATLDVGPTPQNVAVDLATGRIYASNYDSGTVTVIDGANIEAIQRPSLNLSN